MISSPVATVGQDDSFSLVDRMISSPIEASYPCSLGLMGSTSHLINQKGNEDRDHSSTDGCITVSTVLPILG